MGVGIPGFSKCDSTKKFSGCVGVHFSDNPSSDKSTEYKIDELTPTTLNPSAFRFKILLSEYINGNTILLVNYPDCTTFQGNKLLLLRGQYKNFKILDPHFLDENHPVIARFLPNPEGWKMARLCANITDKHYDIYI